MRKLNKQPALDYDKPVVEKGLVIRVDRDTYYALKDIKKVNNYRSIDQTVRELVRYVALASYSAADDVKEI